MTSFSRVCQACGCTGENSQGFQLIRDNNIASKPKQQRATEFVLCPACAVERLRSKDFELLYGLCDQCGTAIEPWHLETRSKTDTIVAGAVASHRTVMMSLCPNCVRAYDGTGKSMMIGMFILVGGIALLALIGWLSG